MTKHKENLDERVAKLKRRGRKGEMSRVSDISK